MQIPASLISSFLSADLQPNITHLILHECYLLPYTRFSELELKFQIIICQHGVIVLFDLGFKAFLI